MSELNLNFYQWKCFIYTSKPPVHFSISRTPLVAAHTPTEYAHYALGIPGILYIPSIYKNDRQNNELPDKCLYLILYFYILFFYYDKLVGASWEFSHVKKKASYSDLYKVPIHTHVAESQSSFLRFLRRFTCL